MCGIVGFLTDGLSEGRPAVVLRAMADTLQHRGPDDAGTWADGSAGIFLGHRRLAVVDLSRNGHQPMVSASSRYVTSFNGEMYNFRDLRKSLERVGHSFRGNSDTEVFLAALEQWGISGAVERFTGMFAFAVWDKRMSSLTLGRDRAGEKPLFYGTVGADFVFGSELKAFSAYPGFPGEIDRDSLAAFLRYSYVPAPHSIFRNIYKLPPGTLLTLRPGFREIPRATSYWKIDDVALKGISARAGSGTKAEPVDELDGILSDAISLQLLADVPSGVFLSGGIDSTTIAALAQAKSQRPIRTFSIGFSDRRYDESGPARAVAAYLGTDHTELNVSAEEALGVIPELPIIFDEPFGDFSGIPTLLLCKMAKEHVSVALSGDGGDELFGGYNRYLWGPSIWKHADRMPRAARHGIGKLLSRLSPERWESINSNLTAFLPDRFKVAHAGDRLHKLSGALSATSEGEFFQRLISSWQDAIVLGAGSGAQSGPEIPCLQGGGTFTDRMMLADFKGYLPGDILTKVDRAAMAVSLETRVPFLDHRVIEFAWRQSPDQKIRDGRGKYLLRKLLRRYVPAELMDRPKMGFGLPLDQWLRGPLRQWASDLLDSDKIRQQGYLNYRLVEQKWKEHQSGNTNCQAPLWNVLMFQAWLESWGRDG